MDSSLSASEAHPNSTASASRTSSSRTSSSSAAMVAEPKSSSQLLQDLGLALALWQRELLRLRREYSRWIGVVVQPLLFWVVLGSGMTHSFVVKGVEDMDYLQYFFPGIIAMILLFTAVFATMSVIEDRQHGFLQQVMVVPGSKLALVLGKTMGVTSVAMIQVALCLLAAPWAGFSYAGIDYPTLIVVVFCACIGLTGLNFIFAWSIDSTAGYHGIMSVFLLPMWMLSGAMYPAGSGWTEFAMRFNPMTYIVDGLRHSISGGYSSVAYSSASTSLVVLVVMAVLGPALTSIWIQSRVHRGRA